MYFWNFFVHFLYILKFHFLYIPIIPLISHFHKRICYDKDNNYKLVSDDLYKNGIFDDNDNEISNNIYRKVTIQDEDKQTKSKKKNDDTRF